MYIYRLEDKKIIEKINNVIKIKEDVIYTSDGNIISGILDSVIATSLEYNTGDTIEDTIENEINKLKVVTDEEMINSLTKSLSVLNVDNKKKDTMINSLTKTLAELNIENKKKDTIVSTLAKSLAELNIKINKFEGGK